MTLKSFGMTRGDRIETEKWTKDFCLYYDRGIHVRLLEKSNFLSSMVPIYVYKYNIYTRVMYTVYGISIYCVSYSL